jgi:hydroxyacylglutathione hydrolase
MIFQSFRLDVNEANAFVVGCETTSEALLVDIGEASVLVEDFLAEHGLQLRTIFISHGHYDHTGGLDAALARHGVEVVSGGGLGAPGRVRRVQHGDEVRIGRLVGRVLATPGHTEDSLSLVFPRMVFTGDALFSGSVGGTSSPRQAKQQIAALREHVLSLPNDYEVHPGHGPASTIKVERRYNPFFS